MTSVELTAFNRAQAASPRVELVGPGVSLPRRIPIVKQDAGPGFTYGTCGPTCVEAVRQYWNPARQVNLSEWPTVQQTAVNAALRGVWNPAAPSIAWCNPEALADTLRQDGLSTRVEYNATPADIARWVAPRADGSSGDTVIVYGLLDGVNPTAGHYRVLEGIDAAGVHLMDPDPDSPSNPLVQWSKFLPQFYNPVTPRGNAIRCNRAPLQA